MCRRYDFVSQGRRGTAGAEWPILAVSMIRGHGPPAVAAARAKSFSTRGAREPAGGAAAAGRRLLRTALGDRGPGRARPEARGDLALPTAISCSANIPAGARIYAVKAGIDEGAGRSGMTASPASAIARPSAARTSSSSLSLRLVRRSSTAAIFASPSSIILRPGES